MEPSTAARIIQVLSDRDCLMLFPLCVPVQFD